MPTALNPARFDLSTVAGLQDYAARCDGWAEHHRRRGALDDGWAAYHYETEAVKARALADSMERKAGRNG